MHIQAPLNQTFWVAGRPLYQLPLIKRELYREAVPSLRETLYPRQFPPRRMGNLSLFLPGRMCEFLLNYRGHFVTGK
jgi:hypothetical protein